MKRPVVLIAPYIIATTCALAAPRPVAAPVPLTKRVSLQKSIDQNLQRANVRAPRREKKARFLEALRKLYEPATVSLSSAS